MRVELTAERPPTVADLDRADRLSVRADGPLEAMRLSPGCRLLDPFDRGHVWVSVALLRSATEPVVGAEAFSGMLAYAAAQDWLGADRTHVRAHVEPTPAT
jgi:hypothetical protein